jgi:hypothetical protein
MSGLGQKENKETEKGVTKGHEGHITFINAKHPD